MRNGVIDINNIDEGIDRKSLSILKDRFLSLNAERLARTAASLSERQQHFLALLPLLFHVNHPLLPGYLSHQMPVGVFNYQPNSDDVRLAKRFAKSFTYARDLPISVPAINALFLMGSVGTIAQSEHSDLDVWVCYHPEVNSEDLIWLQKKCDLLTDFSQKALHIEVHFFLMCAASFHQGTSSILSNEGSGSAQHYLLLDEFYRTAIWLAGKVPLWWFIPAESEHDYAAYARVLLEKKFLPANDVIDFGGVPCIPANEFLGAGIWQLYKGIETPYKSVLKLLLIEVYARSPKMEPLSCTFKRLVYAGYPNANALDPYVLIYRALENYLTQQDQHARLALVRRSFYFKTNKQLTRPINQQKTWQYQLLQEIADTWQWNKATFIHLDNCANWKAQSVLVERSLLVNELTHSYRLLNELAQASNAQAAISNEEITVLGRKLHAAFERKAGKIEWINPGISKNLAERNLRFVFDDHSSTTRWLLYASSEPESPSAPSQEILLKRSRHWFELLLWAYFNGILVQDTLISFSNSTLEFTEAQKRLLLTALYHWLPLPIASPEHDAFSRVSRAERVLLLINLGHEPQAALFKKGLQMLSNQQDALDYSGFRDNLVIHADLVQINSWHEVITRHYDQNALVHALLHYLRLITLSSPRFFPEIRIQCFNQGLGQLIARRLEELWRDILQSFFSGKYPLASRYVFEMSGEYILLQFLQDKPTAFHFKTYKELLDKLSVAQLEYSPILIDRHALANQPLKQFATKSNNQGIWLFYQLHEDNSALADIYVYDERGSVFTCTMPYHSAPSLIKPLLRFIKSTLQRQRLTTNYDNSQLDIYFFERCVQGRQGYYLEPKALAADDNSSDFITIQANAEPNAEGSIDYTVFCDQREFSSLDYGDKLYTAIASYIISRRATKERYPCYITDLDLSLCRDLLAPQTGLQLGHYFACKIAIEQQINTALERIQ